MADAKQIQILFPLPFSNRTPVRISTDSFLGPFLVGMASNRALFIEIVYVHLAYPFSDTLFGLDTRLERRSFALPPKLMDQLNYPWC